MQEETIKPTNMNQNLLLLLECLGAGDKTIMESFGGIGESIYLPKERLRHMSSLGSEFKERSIEGRLMYELFGEYPLRDYKIPAWSKVKKSLRLTQENEAFHNFDCCISSFDASLKKSISAIVAEDDALCIKGSSLSATGAFDVYIKAGYDAIETRIAFNEKLKALKNG